ncbi:MAG: hypothetical protein KJO12_02455 [Ignavibacteria bacterium]|nr:hypothetical protein [Ignavibacteria bacterium]
MLSETKSRYARKIILTIVISFLTAASIHGDDSKYEKAMKKNLSKIDSAAGVVSMLDVANGFERIAFAEKDKWLPYYYASFMLTLASFTDTTADNKDGYLDKADTFINIADSLEEDESEIYVLKGMIAQARMQIDPMNRWMKYGPIANNNFLKSMKIDTLNPRPEYLQGVSLYYTPEQFGGGPGPAKRLLEKSLEKFNLFVPDNDLMPNWGREMVEQMLEQINMGTEQTIEVQADTNDVREKVKKE